MIDGINDHVFSMTKDVMGDKFGNLISTFIKNSDLYVAAINDGYTSRDFSRVEKAAHPLKSSSAMIGFEEFSMLAKQTEALAKEKIQGQQTDHDIGDVIQSLNNQYGHVKDFLNVHLKEYADKAATEVVLENKLNVMQIDDDAVICKVTQQFLEGAGEFNVQNYLSISDAMAGLNDYRPNVLLLDFTLKDMEGVETILNLKSDSRLNDTLIILVTGHEQETIQDEMSDFIDGYLSKPYTPEALINKIKQVCL